LLKFDFVAPRSAEDAVAQLQQRGPGGKLLAGGTDLLLQVKARTIRPSYVVDLSHLPELRRLEYRPGEGLWIGAMVRMRTLQQSPLLRGRYAIIADGAGLVGSIQIRNLATVGGNLCNAAPSADVAPPLLALGASAEILSPTGRRSIPLDDFFQGPRRTALGPADLLLGVRVPESPAHAGGHYLRHTPRKEMDIAVVGVGAAVTLDDGQCRDARIVLGAVGPTPLRATRAEAALRGQRLSPALLAEVSALAAEAARPIDDVRGSATFRRHLVAVLTGRTLGEAWQRAATNGG
jgi:CO/xanthine dehydrogenase FAD-binding subunit